MISVYIKGNKVQLRKDAKTAKVVHLTGWKSVKDLDMPKLQEYVRMANRGQRVALAKAFHMVEGP